MGKSTGIGWTDSTYNSHFGCTKVEGAIACIDCYAEVVDKRATPIGEQPHWGHGAPRRRMSEHARNEPYRWQKNADKFFSENGRRQRVFTLSMGDLFDKEIPDEWRIEHMKVMEDCDKLEWQICTKRAPQISKMVPQSWKDQWPQHIGVLITVVTQQEADRDIPRLLRMTRDFGIPWTGISYEPAAEEIELRPYIDSVAMAAFGARLSWVIFGGKSGAKWKSQPFDLDWARKTRDDCAAAGTAFFMKQAAAFRPTDDMIPADLMIRQWPKGH